MSFPAYEEYKDSGVDWIGSVPVSWRIAKLKFVAGIVGGGTPNREKPEFWNGGIPWVSPKDMKAERVTGAEETITELGLQESSTSLQDVGSVLMVIRSGILQHSIPIAINDVPVALNQDMKSFRFDAKEILPKFFLRWVQGLSHALLLAWANQGATVESIDQNLLKGTVFPIPPLEEQEAIAKFLDAETSKIDALVAEQRRLIELLAEKRQAVISHAVTKGLDPHVRMKPSGIEWLGDVPEHWEVVALKHLVSHPIIDGPHESPQRCDQGIPFVSAESISKGFVDFNKIWGYISPTDHERYSKRFKPKRGDILLIKLGATTGVPAIVETDEDFNVWVPIAAIRLKHGIQPRFIFHILRSNQLRRAYELNWTYGTQQTLGLGTISNLRIPMPPEKERDEIVQYLDELLPKYEDLINEAEIATSLLQERRTALISAAVTGKFDVRDFSAANP